MKKKDKFKLAAYGAIVYAILSIPIFVVAILQLFYETSLFLKYFYVVLVAVTFIASVNTTLGYFIISKDHKLKYLRILAVISIVFSSIAMVLLILKSYLDTPNLVYTLLTILSGIISIGFGIILKKMKKNILKFSDTVGLWYLIQGIALCTIIGYILVPFISVVVSILEAKMFFNKARNTK